MSAIQTKGPSSVLSTGVRGLDVVLEGGLLVGGVYILQGRPGAGKTILGNQMCFHHAQEGQRALYVTLLAESHSRMMAHMGSLSFFDQAAIPSRLTYLSAFRVLEEEGLDGLFDLLRRELQSTRSSLLVLDGLVAVEESANSPVAFKKFIHELQTLTAIVGSTAILLTSTGASPLPVAAEHTMVDGVIEMSSRLYGRRSERDLQILKRRGRGYLQGRHSFKISGDGIEVHPRVEALLEQPSRPDFPDRGRISTGLSALDQAMDGGLLHPTTTLVIGPAGVGKTTLGLHFLGGCSDAEPGLLFGFYETPERIAAQAATLRLPLSERLQSGVVEALWQPATEGMFDEICGRLLSAVRARKVRRLFLDGLDGLAKLAVEPDRVGHAMTALANELRSLDVTTLYTSEAELGAPVLGNAYAGLSIRGVSTIAENAIVMRYVNLYATHHRLISVLKARNTSIDDHWHRYEMTAAGIAIEPDAAGAERVLRSLSGASDGRYIAASREA